MRRLPSILLVLLCMLSPLAAWAEPALRASASQVRAGETLVIEWSQLPAGTHEVELELSLDGGRWLRISPELEAHEGRFAWTLPAGLSGAARIRLRYGRDHEEHEGGMIALSIITPADTARPDMTRESGEWWQLDREVATPLAHALSDTAHLAPITATLAAVPSDPTLAVFQPALAPAFGQALPPEPAARITPRAFAPPRNTPLRN